jgi:PBP1b-binding outer membrane lipoprotein LpoB
MRKLAFLNVLVLLALVLAACGCPKEEPIKEPTKAPEPTTEAATKAPEETPTEVPTEEVAGYGESPMLADMVVDGDLPAVEDRLPTTPQVPGSTW